jgi:hypothetical protein
MIIKGMEPYWHKQNQIRLAGYSACTQYCTKVKRSRKSKYAQKLVLIPSHFLMQPGSERNTNYLVMTSKNQPTLYPQLRYTRIHAGTTALASALCPTVLDLPSHRAGGPNQC